MYVEEKALGEDIWRYFLIPGRKFPEIFSARMKKGGTTLEILWTSTLGGPFLNRLAKVQGIVGGPGSFIQITGQASETLRELIDSERFNAKEAARALTAKLGGKWELNVNPRPNSVPKIWNVIATRLGD